MKLKEEKKSIRQLISTRTPQNLLLALELGRGLGIERWVECALVRGCLEVEDRVYINSRDCDYSLYIGYKQIVSFGIGVYFRTRRRMRSSEIYDIHTNVGEIDYLKDMLNLEYEDYNYYSTSKLKSIVFDFFINYVKYILPYEL